MFSGIFQKAREIGSNFFHLGQKAVKNLAHLGRKATHFVHSQEFNDVVDALSKINPAMAPIKTMVQKGVQGLHQATGKVKQFDKMFNSTQNALKRWDNTDAYHHGQKPHSGSKYQNTIERTPKRIVSSVHNDGNGFFGSLFREDPGNNAPSTRSNL